MPHNRWLPRRHISPTLRRTTTRGLSEQFEGGLQTSTLPPAVQHQTIAQVSPLLLATLSPQSSLAGPASPLLQQHRTWQPAQAKLQAELRYSLQHDGEAGVLLIPSMSECLACFALCSPAADQSRHADSEGTLHSAGVITKTASAAGRLQISVRPYGSLFLDGVSDGSWPKQRSRCAVLPQ